MTRTLRIATRESPLALWQANEVRDRLIRQHPDLSVELLPMTTHADQNQTTSLAKIGGKGLFIKELETALLDERADLAVHSMKDVVPELPTGLMIDTVLAREDPGDALVSTRYASLSELPEGAVIGTCSPRRQAQLLAHLPHLDIRQLRGNVNTRLARLDAGDFDAIVLACAGLKRLGMADRIRQVLPHAVCLPAVGQGIVGIETRRSDRDVHELLRPLQHEPSFTRLTAEREFSATLVGGCSAPIAGYSTLDDRQQLTLTGRVIAFDGSTLLEDTVAGPADSARQLGHQLATALLQRGARALLDEAELSHQN